MLTGCSNSNLSPVDANAQSTTCANSGTCTNNGVKTNVIANGADNSAVTNQIQLRFVNQVAS